MKGEFGISFLHLSASFVSIMAKIKPKIEYFVHASSDPQSEEDLRGIARLIASWICNNVSSSKCHPNQENDSNRPSKVANPALYEYPKER